MPTTEKIMGDLLNEHNHLTLERIRQGQTTETRQKLAYNTAWRQRVYDLAVYGDLHELHIPISA